VKECFERGETLPSQVTIVERFHVPKQTVSRGMGLWALAEAGRLAESHQLDELRKGPEVFLHGALAVRARETLSAREGEANFPTLRKGKSQARS
jgi:hypothetical protein